MPDLTDTARRSLVGMDRLLLAIKSTGGFKYRQYLRGSEVEIKEMIDRAVPTLYRMVVSLIVAEEIMREPDGYSGSNRWARYEAARDELIRALAPEAVEEKAG